MALENILEKIRDDSEFEAENIINQAKKDAEKIIAGAEAQTASISAEAELSGTEKALREKEKVITMAYLESRKKILSAKQRILQEIFEETRKRLLQLDEKEYSKFMKMLIISGCSGGKATVIPGIEDRRLINRKLIDEINTELKGECKIELSAQDTQVKRGFILQSGRIEMDNSTDNIINTVREKTTDEIAGMLFIDI
jgi:V/A-type H+-transporting ATPase subunit E